MVNEMRVNYEITPLTLAVLAEEIDGHYTSVVMEDDQRFFVNKPPSRLIDYACKFFGSSLRGRQEGTKGICGITHKAPISIDPSSGMYFFPTSSPLNPDCSWISHSHIDRILKISTDHSAIIFKNGSNVTLEISHGSLLNQLQRTAQFRYLLDNRIKYLLKNTIDIVAEPF
ncbi:competence protein ComK [Aquibacillus salsiterrae]|uniref:Competence protein ComK n=1 Tax=Aquibacillus salsiterrae TaxID=2950439 RepID=A0A9X4AES2_9BACI|nr:competence protein ComK [Aquibacillus salsiterrae]MDC3417247.1 competence protein ComK [Aquibacillus salsiterrae]